MPSTHVSDPDSVRPARGAGVASRPQDVARRWLSGSSVFPLGAFLLIHAVWTTVASRGEDDFAALARALRSAPVRLLEWVLVLGPLAAHAVAGLWAVATRRSAGGSSPRPARFHVALHTTGALGFAFVAAHLVELRGLPLGASLEQGQAASVLVADLSSVWLGVPWRGAMYLVGAGCIVFHFAAGLWGFFATTRAGAGIAARRWAGWAAGALGAVVWALFANSVVYYATGSRLFGSGGDRESPREACPSEKMDTTPVN